ncbi:MAG TPA: ABC transporter substrate-binding protein [Chloroflexus aurantiacus]|uniref:Periplasmic solute binding protein n=1 Tax=Chloroflexus aurantiacus (strain ATCC 29366 / DSM 635 / J-10-fl) TaxID=324602 RepID=A9WEE6_CHLAA|nr:MULTISPECIES: metal ABC transporter substrate-binding protein [Chloroflexus]ABY35208.1 periplasmic solute binding protein [Chloroflexus aurantiacus J-10-fl]RMG53297.1 MAG: zinc ABC transporter substrate-binding protein [Chloroflexota bacterium]GIV92392.1 MAG: ABC transporter substrate-binding protein [Chloroflexus sp.]HBW68619.1 ABC transporter substrate-binding protein [Chloroflexus aurantiacus]
MRFIQQITVLLAGMLLMAACGQAPASQPTAVPATDNTSAQPMLVMASTSIVADVVRQVGGDRVQVETIVPIGADTHGFEPTPQDLARVSEARVIFTVGAGYEEFIDRLIASSGTQAEVVDLSANLALRALTEAEATGHAHEEEHTDEHGTEAAGAAGDTHADDHSNTQADAHGDEHGDEHADEHGAGSVDPHTWTDPANVKIWTDLIYTTLSRLDPDHAEAYATRATDYKRQLDDLDRWIADQFASIPAERRLLVSDHIIFGYMADKYGLRQLGAIIPGVSSSAAPSAQELAALQDLIADYGVTAIFVGNVANQQIAEQIARDTGVRIITVLTESLTDANGPGATYLDYMRFNVQAIVDGLRS